MANPGAGPEASHKSWLAAKKAAGWKFGDEKDEEKKTHPCMVPFNKLPASQQFKDVLFKTVFDAMAPNVAAAEALHDARDAAVEQFDTAVVERDQAREQLAALTATHETTLKDLAAVTAERDAATADLAKASKAVEKGKADLKAARAKAAPKPAKLREIGPVADQPRGDDLLTLIGAADTVELVFSDGKREIGKLPPQLIEGDAWAQAANGVRLRGVSLPVYGPAHDQPAIRLAGYGLLLDGELTAYAPRIEVLELKASQHADLKDDVIFN